jgi:hypothetical protein
MFRTSDRLSGFLTVGAVAVALAACSEQATGPLSHASAAKSDIVPASASYIIDTGPGGTASVGASSLFSAGSTTCSPQPACAGFFQYLGGQFVLANDANVESVEGWMSVTLGGSVKVHIRTDSVNAFSQHIPAHSVDSATYVVAPQAYGWKVFSGFNLNLSAGTYWLTFEPVPNTGFNGGMIGPSTNPLPGYAHFNEGNNRWVPFSTNPQFGMRVFGTEVLPPPGDDTAEEMIADLQTIVADLNVAKGTATSIDSKLQLALAALEANEVTTACGYLQDAINYIRAQSGKKISTATAAELTAQITAIRTEIGC